MFKTDYIFGQQKLSLNQNVRFDHATMQQDVLLYFWVISQFFQKNEQKQFELRYHKLINAV